MRENTKPTIVRANKTSGRKDADGLVVPKGFKHLGIMGRPIDPNSISIERLEKMLRRIDRVNGCWIIGSRARGYPTAYVLGVDYRMHRLLKVVVTGKDIPFGMVPDHVCRNTFCVNPAHIDIVTPSENSKRGMVGLYRREVSRAMTHCKSGHERTPENIGYSRESRRPDRPKIICKVCRVIWQEKTRARRKARAVNASV